MIRLDTMSVCELRARLYTVNRNVVKFIQLHKANHHFCILYPTTEPRHGPKRQTVRAAASAAIKRAMPAYLLPNRSHVDGKQRASLLWQNEAISFYLSSFFADIRFVHNFVAVDVRLQHIPFDIHTIDKTLSVAILSVKRDFIFLNAHTHPSQTNERKKWKKESVK